LSILCQKGRDAPPITVQSKWPPVDGIGGGFVDQTRSTNYLVDKNGGEELFFIACSVL
jgi:hypothetical protein